MVLWYMYASRMNKTLTRRVFIGHCIIQILVLDIYKLAFYRYTYGLYSTNSIKQASKRICRKMLKIYM